MLFHASINQASVFPFGSFGENFAGGGSHFSFSLCMSLMWIMLAGVWKQQMF